MAVEGGKGLMMADRPPAPSGGGGGGGDGGGVSIGNYKGIMLCNRPFAGTAAAAAPGGDPNKPAPFVAGLVPESLHPRGFNPSISQTRTVAAVHKTKRSTALAKHKQWLRDLQVEREQLLEEQDKEAMDKEARHQRFLAAQQRMRDVVRGLAEVAVENVRVANGAGQSTYDVRLNPNAGPGPVLPQERALQSSILSAEQQRKLEKKKYTMPAWAYTQESKERAEEDEADELLKFAEGLDFDKFVEDEEVRVAMEQAKMQLQALERENAEAEAADAEAEALIAAENAAARRAAAAAEREARGDARVEEEEKGGGMPLTEDALKALQEQHGGANPISRVRDVDSETVMSAVSAAHSIRNVHSKKSLNVVISKERQGTPAGPSTEGLAPPRIVVVDDSDGARLKTKKLVSNLPFMNRNPAV